MAQVLTSEFITRFWPIVEDMIPSFTRHPYQCEEAFFLAHTLFKRLAETKIEFLDLDKLIKAWGILLVQHECVEVSSSHTARFVFTETNVLRLLDIPKASILSSKD